MSAVLLVGGLLMVAIWLTVRWFLRRPDPMVIPQTLERKQMRLRDESSQRWD